MNKTINIQEILKQHLGVDETDMGAMQGLPVLTEAIKEIVEAVIDKCAEDFIINQLESSWGHKTGEVEIDPESILDVKKMINYE